MLRGLGFQIGRNIIIIKLVCQHIYLNILYIVILVFYVRVFIWMKPVVKSLFFPFFHKHYLNFKTWKCPFTSIQFTSIQFFCDYKSNGDVFIVARSMQTPLPHPVPCVISAHCHGRLILYTYVNFTSLIVKEWCRLRHYECMQWSVYISPK